MQQQMVEFTWEKLSNYLNLWCFVIVQAFYWNVSKIHGQSCPWVVPLRTSCHAKWGGRLAISLSSVWRLGWIDWSFLSAFITPAWRVVVALSFWWMHSRYLRRWRRVMMAPESLKDDGGWKRGRIEWSEREASVGSLRLPEMFLRRDWRRWRQIFFWSFWEDRFRGSGEESSGQTR